MVDQEPVPPPPEDRAVMFPATPQPGDLRDRARAAKLRHKAAKARLKAHNLEEKAQRQGEKADAWEAKADELDGVAKAPPA